MKQLQYVLLACGLAATAGIHAPPKKKKAPPGAKATDFAGDHIIMNGNEPALTQHIADLKAALASTDTTVYWNALAKLYAERELAQAYTKLAAADHKSHGTAFVAAADTLYATIRSTRIATIEKVAAQYRAKDPKPALTENYVAQRTYYVKLYENLKTNKPADFSLAIAPGAGLAAVKKIGQKVIATQAEKKAAAIADAKSKVPTATATKAISDFVTKVSLALSKDSDYQAIVAAAEKKAKATLAREVAKQWLQHSSHATAADKAKVIPAIVSGVLKAPDGATADSIKIAPIPTPKPKGAGSKMSPEIQANLVNLGDALIALQQAAGI